ncbi:tyrosine-type recombinase/integrase [Bacillaceae bacterium IKA-2]|nr:tyrosine-type recombinase/integrase [Bacillaceae bacterium IKA-2]
MKTLLEEINSFLDYSFFSIKTRKAYKLRLDEFSFELAEMTNTNITEVHLSKIYLYVDNKGEFIRYKPLDIELVESYFVKNMKYKSRSWLRYSRQALSSFFIYLFRKYDFINIVDQMCFKATDFRDKSRPVKILTRHQLLRFFHCMVSNSDIVVEDILLFIILITTGGRISEVLDLKFENINWDEKTALLSKTKNNRNRMLIFRDELPNAIRFYCKKKHIQENDYLFSISYNDVRNRLSYYLKMANLPHVRIHSLRHTFATLMYESNGDISVIKQLLDHSGLSTTKSYIHPNYVINGQMKIKENEDVYKNLEFMFD